MNVLRAPYKCNALSGSLSQCIWGRAPSIYVGSTRTPQNLNETYTVALQEIEQVENLLSTAEVEIREIRGLLDALEG